MTWIQNMKYVLNVFEKYTTTIFHLIHKIARVVLKIFMCMCERLLSI